VLWPIREEARNAAAPFVRRIGYSPLTNVYLSDHSAGRLLVWIGTEPRLMTLFGNLCGLDVYACLVRPTIIDVGTPLLRRGG
jgi:hypothetical protein